MVVLLVWLALSLAVGSLASGRGRNAVLFFALSIFLSPLIAGIALYAIPKKFGWRCPECMEPVQREARRCKHCGSSIKAISNRPKPLPACVRPGSGTPGGFYGSPTNNEDRCLQFIRKRAKGKGALAVRA